MSHHESRANTQTPRGPRFVWSGGPGAPAAIAAGDVPSSLIVSNARRPCPNITHRAPPKRFPSGTGRSSGTRCGESVSLSSSAAPHLFRDTPTSDQSTQRRSLAGRRGGHPGARGEVSGNCCQPPRAFGLLSANASLAPSQVMKITV